MPVLTQANVLQRVLIINVLSKPMKLSKTTKKIAVSFVSLGILLLFVSVAHAQTSIRDSVLGNLASASPGLSGDDPREIVINIINWVLSVIGVIFLGFFIYGGFLWLTAAGNKDQLGKAKSTLKDGIVGLLIIFLAFGIANMVFVFLAGV